MRTCTECQEPKPKTEYYKSADRKDKLNPLCKVCYRKKYDPYKNHPWRRPTLAKVDDFRRNHNLKYASNEDVMIIVKGAIADELGKKSLPTPKPIITWESFQKTRIALKTY